VQTFYQKNTMFVAMRMYVYTVVCWIVHVTEKANGNDYGHDGGCFVWFCILNTFERRVVASDSKEKR
jgi:hypothetical protein